MSFHPSSDAESSMDEIHRIRSTNDDQKSGFKLTGWVCLFTYRFFFHAFELCLIGQNNCSCDSLPFSEQLSVNDSVFGSPNPYSQSKQERPRMRWCALEECGVYSYVTFRLTNVATKSTQT